MIHLIKSLMLLLFKGVDEFAKQKSYQQPSERLETDIVSDSEEEGVRPLPGQDDMQIRIEDPIFFKNYLQ